MRRGREEWLNISLLPPLPPLLIRTVLGCDRTIRATTPFDYHKIEGMELVPRAEGGVIVGTDDENLGFYVYILGVSS